MRVAFNATALTGPLTGVGQYAYQLALALQRLPGLELSLFYAGPFDREVRPRGNPHVAQLRPAVRRYVPYAYEIARWKRQRRFTRGVRSLGLELYHEPNFLAYDFDGPLVLTVHDLSWIRFPETHPAERVRAMHKYFEPGLKRAQVVLTDSEFVKREIVEVFGLDADRIRAIPIGLDPVFRPMREDETRSALARHALRHGEYLLSVGTLEPRKNLERTVRAYGLLPAALRARYPLVIVGASGWRTQAIQAVLGPLVAGGEAKVLGYLDRGELAAVTAGATAMVYPSIYEGFGLPPLEAMGCGVPAVASNVSSPPEVVGDAGWLVEPLDVEAIAGAMRAALEDAPLRSALSAQALERSARFTWDACAAETYAAYRDAVASSR
jgi:glycosyltransferase involved in cell wall biosynthesis